MLPLACVCARNSIVRYSKFEWAAAYHKTIAKIVNYGESTKKEFVKDIISKLISVYPFPGILRTNLMTSSQLAC